MLETKAGAYTPFDICSQEQRDVFETTMKGWMGAGYTPLACSTQVVNGVNYRFICTVTPTTENPMSYLAEVDLYQAPGEKAIVTGIEDISLPYNNNIGGYSPYHLCSVDEMAVLSAATEKLVGVKYYHIACSTQVVKGTNYRFICKAEMVAPDAEPYLALVDVYQAPGEDPVVVHIERVHLSETNVICQSYSAYHECTGEELSIFNIAMKDWVGVGYKPVACSSQLVAGMNYKYLCIANTIVPDSKPYIAVIKIYDAPSEDPKVTNIQKKKM